MSWTTWRAPAQSNLWIFAFHMPMFVLHSGYLSKHLVTTNEARIQGRASSVHRGEALVGLTDQIGRPFTLMRFVAFLPFFLSGYYLKATRSGDCDPLPYAWERSWCC